MPEIFIMVENVVKVRAKPLTPARGLLARPFFSLLVLVGLALAAYLGYQFLTGKTGSFNAPLTETQGTAGKIIKVPAGGDLQAAIDRAESGDIIELQAGATYYGEIKLANKNLTDFVTVRSSAADKLPVDKRVGPGDAASMARIVAKGGGTSALSAGNGANHYRFVGIEFTSDGSGYVYNLILFGAGETSRTKVPHNLEIDRSYLHPSSTGITRRGIALNSGNTVIKNSYIEGFGFPGEETQGICGWTGTRNVKIINNYIEGGAENIMFGGSDPVSADLIPSQIEIRGNYINKPAQWKGKAAVKTLFELKNAIGVQLVGNTLTNNWRGSAFRITVRNEENHAPFSTVQDVEVRDNIIIGAGEGINILGKDDIHPSQTLKRLTIANNLFLNIGGDGFEGSGYFIQISDGEDITIANNTVFNTGNITSFYGTMPRNFLVRDNIMGHGNYGIHGHSDIKSTAGQRLYQNNIIVNNRRIDKYDSSFPPNNFWITDYASIGFTNLSQNDLRLAANSKFKARGINRTDIGCDIDRLPTEGVRKLSK